MILCHPMNCSPPLSMGCPRQKHWSGLSFPSPGDLPNPEVEPMSPASAGGFFTTSHQGSPTDDTSQHNSLCILVKVNIKKKICQASIIGRTGFPHTSYIEVPAPSSSVWDCIWRKSFGRGDEVIRAGLSLNWRVSLQDGAIRTKRSTRGAEHIGTAQCQGSHLRAKGHDLRGSQPCLHLGLGLPASCSVTKQTSIF